MMRTILMASLLVFSACTAKHGGPDDPIASADFPFQRELANELALEAEAFAKANGLAFQSQPDRGTLFFRLSKDDLTIETSNREDPRRLKIIATGPVTPVSIELANRYITDLGAVH